MEPDRVTAGDTVAWNIAGGDYPSDDGWTVAYHFASPTAKIDPVTATADGSGGHDVAVPASETKLWGAGSYAWQRKASKGAEVFTAATGTLIVDASLEGVDHADTRSWAARTLEAVECALAESADSDVVSWSIGGRSGTRMTRDEAMAYRDRLQFKVTQEIRAADIAAGRGHSGRILVVK